MNTQETNDEQLSDEIFWRRRLIRARRQLLLTSDNSHGADALKLTIALAERKLAETISMKLDRKLCHERFD